MYRWLIPLSPLLFQVIWLNSSWRSAILRDQQHEYYLWQSYLLHCICVTRHKVCGNQLFTTTRQSLWTNRLLKHKQISNQNLQVRHTLNSKRSQVSSRLLNGLAYWLFKNFLWWKIPGSSLGFSICSHESTSSDKLERVVILCYFHQSGQQIGYTRFRLA